MPKVLTVDDSKAIRTIVGKQMKGFGFEVDEAEDGEKGLEKLATGKYDLVLLDVTMPVLDGPGMLKKLRERGDRTPVIMLTSESKTSIIGETMKLGIEDYILKPFKPDEIRDKVFKVMKAHGAAGPANDAGPAPAAGAPVNVPQQGGKQFIDILSVDDMDNVHKKLRGLLPDHVSFNSCVSAQAALQLAREKVFRVVLVDSTLPDVNSVALMNQMRILQPHAQFVSMALRSEHGAEAEALNHGFAGSLLKPFDGDGIADFMGAFFDNQDQVSIDDDMVTLHAFKGKDEKVDRYFAKVKEITTDALNNVAAACFEHVYIDFSAAPHKPEKIVNLVIEMRKLSTKLGLEMRIVGTPEIEELFKGFTDTADIPFFDTVDAARAAA